MDMFRAVVNENEKSERALGLTEDIIRMNAGHYTVWCVSISPLDYKAQTIKALQNIYYRGIGFRSPSRIETYG